MTPSLNLLPKKLSYYFDPLKYLNQLTTMKKNGFVFFVGLFADISFRKGIFSN